MTGVVELSELKSANARHLAEITALKALVQQLLARIEALENGSGKSSGRPLRTREIPVYPLQKKRGNRFLSLGGLDRGLIAVVDHLK
ncbi:hypothetical protein B5F76_01405 [Desulfovibrio sp. An276]|nr:hypothetical protein B5F76_01405 [Desulfovibrio sp. An276]